MEETIVRLKETIESVWEDHTLLRNLETKAAIDEVVAMVDRGELRCAQPDGEGVWAVNEWVKKAVILYFPTRELRTMNAGELEFYDKIDIKHNYKEIGARIVPPAIVRYGSFIGRGVIMMPSFVNVGAYIDEGTMVETWARVGSCAQIGKDVHISGGVNIGGVLEPLQAAPVIVEDNCFIGSQCSIVESVRIGKEAVLGAGLTLTASSKIIDVTGEEPVEYRGFIPERSVVIQGTYSKEFSSGVYGVPCALIVGKRKESTDKRLSLTDALREFSVPV